MRASYRTYRCLISLRCLFHLRYLPHRGSTCTRREARIAAFPKSISHERDNKDDRDSRNLVNFSSPRSYIAFSCARAHKHIQHYGFNNIYLKSKMPLERYDLFKHPPRCVCIAIKVERISKLAETGSNYLQLASDKYRLLHPSLPLSLPFCSCASSISCISAARDSGRSTARLVRSHLNTALGY